MFHKNVEFKGEDIFIFDIKISLQEDNYLVEGDCTADFSVECARCLKPLTVKQEISFKDLYIKDSSDLERLEVEFSGNIFFIEDGNINLDHSIIAALAENPIYPVLCSEDCLGLCPVCGKNLNEGNCSCNEEKIDPRLEALKKFKF